MAKSYKNVKLESEEEPKHFYTTQKPTKGLGASQKLRLRKYNPRAMEHQWYKEVRLKQMKCDCEGCKRMKELFDAMYWRLAMKKLRKHREKKK